MKHQVEKTAIMDPKTELNAYILMAPNWKERMEGGGFI